MPFPALPDGWTPIATRDAPASFVNFGILWRWAEGWDQVTVNDLRDAGVLLTAQRRGADGVMVLLARAARHASPAPRGALRRGLSDAGRDLQRVAA